MKTIHELQAPIMIELFKDRSIKEGYIKHVFPSFGPFSVRRMVDRWTDKEHEINAYWRKYPLHGVDQALFTKGLFNGVSAEWVERGCVDWLIDSGHIEPREILFWGQNLDVDGNKLEHTKWRLIKNMTRSHINAIIKDHEEGSIKVTEGYLRAFKSEIQKRNESSKKQGARRTNVHKGR